jgi:hypothetical protein
MHALMLYSVPALVLHPMHALMLHFVPALVLHSVPPLVLHPVHALVLHPVPALVLHPVYVVVLDPMSALVLHPMYLVSLLQSITYLSHFSVVVRLSHWRWRPEVHMKWLRQRSSVLGPAALKELLHV